MKHSPSRAHAHRCRRIVSEAAKLLGPQPEPEPGEELNLVNLPTDLLVSAGPARGTHLSRWL